MQSFERRPTVSTLLAPGQDNPRMFHQPREDWAVLSEFFLRAALHMALDGSDDTAQQHHCVLLDQSVSKVSSPMTVSSDVTSAFGILSYTISERNCCRLRVAFST